MWYLYVLRCKDGSLYTGIALDVRKRLAQHRAGKGSKFVRSRLPFTLVHRLRFRTRSAALKKEALVKSWSRQKKLRWLAA